MARVGNINLTRATWETGTLVLDGGRVHRLEEGVARRFVMIATVLPTFFFLPSTPVRSFLHYLPRRTHGSSGL